MNAFHPVRISTLLLLLLACLGGGAAHSIPNLVIMNTTAATFFTSGAQARLEEAIRMNDAMAIGRVLADGALVNARGKHEATPLMIAVDTQTPDAVQALLQAGADPNLKAVDGNSAVSLATESYNVKPHGRAILTMIMKGGGNPDSLRPDRDPVITRFIYDHDLDDVRWFKTLGANLDIIGRGNEPLITSVAMAQNWDAVWCLIELGARYDYEHGKSMQPLSEALSVGYPSPDSPLYPYKLKVWQLMKDKGLPVKPMKN
jgi:ankyrin repeat protein